MDIPIYDSAGSRAGIRSQESINRLLSVNAVTVVRNRRGDVVRAMMRQPDGKPGVSSSGRLHVPYVTNQHLSDGHHAYKHKPLPKSKDNTDMLVRSIFRRVQIDCIVAS